MAARRRLDAEMVRRGLATSRTEAQAHIAAGSVLVGGAPADKAARLVDAGDAVVVVGPPPRFVSRGGEKLAAALDRFGIDPAGAMVLDVGASTGGFTDCLLQRGAARVVAVDVGHGQLHERLRADPAVVVLERVNARELRPDQVGAPLDAAVADVSFISLAKVLPPMLACVVPGGWAVVLAKPQFEAGRAEVSKGRGVVRDPAVWARVLHDVSSAAVAAGAAIMDAMVSPLRGADGNVEFLLALSVGSNAPGVAVDLDAVVASVDEAGEG